jgi:Flp pilus assembly protein TadG
MTASPRRGPKEQLIPALLRCLGASGANVAVEFALVAPVFFLLLFGVVETGRLIWSATTLRFAVEETARCAAINQTLCGTPAAAQSYAVTRAPGLGMLPSSFTISLPPCGSQVVGTYQFQPLAANVFPTPLTLSATSCFPV